MNAYTAEERTCYYAVAAAEFFSRLCDVLCDLYMNPKLAPPDIERERGVICEEILMYRDEPLPTSKSSSTATSGPTIRSVVHLPERRTLSRACSATIFSPIERPIIMRGAQ